MAIDWPLARLTGGQRGRLMMMIVIIININDDRSEQLIWPARPLAAGRHRRPRRPRPGGVRQHKLDEFVAQL